MMRFLLITLLFAQWSAQALTLPCKDAVISTIVMGSCNREDLPQSFWSSIAQRRPDLWLWLGDNVYADTEDMSVMRSKYAVLKNHPGYTAFRKQVPILGIWDDHDYGVNDGNRLFSKKAEAKQQFMDFMDIPEQHPMRTRAGIYARYVFGPPGKQIKLILLDTRSFQDPLQRTPKGSKKNYQANLEGTVLGEQQWQWLKNELTESTADVHIIASSIQVIPQDHKYEMWANFPKERERLFDLVLKSHVMNPIFLSGDRHLSELSKLKWKGKVLYDITSSGMTHSFSGNQEYNRHRQGQLVTVESFAELDFHWDQRILHVRHLDMQGQVLQVNSIALE